MYAGELIPDGDEKAGDVGLLGLGFAGEKAPSSAVDNGSLLPRVMGEERDSETRNIV